MKSAVFIFPFLVLLISSTSFAAVQWMLPATGGITGAGVLLAGKSIFTSYDGNVYAIRATAGGQPSWVFDTGGSIALEPVALDAFTLAVATTDGRVVFLNAEDRSIRADYSFNALPYALAAGDGKVYLGLNGSILALSPANKVVWNASIPGAPGQIGVGSGNIYFTVNGALYSIDDNSGTIRWASSVADSFLTRPTADSGSVYLGGTDGRLYSINYANGAVQWSYPTGGWVMSSPTVDNGIVYFGSNDGYLYALSNAGDLKWKFYSGSAIWSAPLVSGKQVVFGNNGGQVFGLDSATGAEIWSFSADGRAYSPLADSDNGAFIFGTSHGIIYSLSSSPICSFSYPNDGDAVGSWPVDLEGRAYSESGIDHVDVLLQDGSWQQADGAENWFAAVDFTGKAPGGYTVECRATDKSGRSETGQYSLITLIEQSTLSPQDMYLSAPTEVAPTDNFTLSVTDSRGVDLRGVTITVGDAKKTGNSPFGVELGKSGPVQITVEKPGFNPQAITVTGTGGGSILVPAIIVIVLAGAVYFLVIKRFLAKKQQ